MIICHSRFGVADRSQADQVDCLQILHPSCPFPVDGSDSSRGDRSTTAGCCQEVAFSLRAQRDAHRRDDGLVLIQSSNQQDCVREVKKSCHPGDRLRPAVEKRQERNLRVGDVPIILVDSYPHSWNRSQSLGLQRQEFEREWPRVSLAGQKRDKSGRRQHPSVLRVENQLGPVLDEMISYSIFAPVRGGISDQAAFDTL